MTKLRLFEEIHFQRRRVGQALHVFGIRVQTVPNAFIGMQFVETVVPSRILAVGIKDHLANVCLRLYHEVGDNFYRVRLPHS